MDKAAQVAATANFYALKEPRGFIKCIEFILAIFAFATISSHSSSWKFKFIDCIDQATGQPCDKTGAINFGYPFRLEESKFEQYCVNTTGTNPYGNNSGPAEFFCFVGVMAFLYTMAAVVLYVFFDEKYRKYEMIPKADFIIHVIFVVFWFIGSCVWAQGLSDTKWYSDPEECCRLGRIPDCNPEGQCKLKITQSANFASLNVSVIFGFLNAVVWGSNLWFLFKETNWFKVKETMPPAQSPSSETPQVIPQTV